MNNLPCIYLEVIGLFCGLPAFCGLPLVEIVSIGSETALISSIISLCLLQHEPEKREEYAWRIF
jgi:hypothetical protein